MLLPLGVRDFRGSDLRKRLESRHSPSSKRFSPGRDGRGRQSDRGYSHSRSPPRGRSSRSPSPLKHGLHKSDRKEKKRRRVDEPDAQFSDISGELGDQTTWVNDSPGKAAKAHSSNPINSLEEELRKVHCEIKSLDDCIMQAESSLEKKAEEVNELMVRNLELDSKLQKEQEVHKRINSKLKKFVKVYLRCSRAQEEVKKTQVRLHKLVEDFRLGEVTKVPFRENDSEVNIVSDVEPEQPLNSHFEIHSQQMIGDPSKDDSDMDGNVKKKITSASHGKTVVQPSRADPMESGISIKGTNADVSSCKLMTSAKSERIGSPQFVNVLNKVRSWDMGTALTADAEYNVVENDNHKQGPHEIMPEENVQTIKFQSLPGKTDLKESNKYTIGLVKTSVITSNEYAQYEGDDEEVDVEILDDDIDSPVGITLNAKHNNTFEKGKSLFPIT